MRPTSTLRCPSCGELASGDRETCLGCGSPIADESLPFERRVRAFLIALLVLGAMTLLGSELRDWLRTR